MDNTSKNSTSTNNSSPPPSPPPNSPQPEQNTPTEANPREGSFETNMKTPEEVLAELSVGDDGIIGNGGRDGGNGDSAPALAGAPRAVTAALTVDGRSHSSTVEGVGGGATALKKRKNTQVKDPPPGTPTCPECGRKFSTWKAAFGHMRKHPERAHRGFFPPPTFKASNIAPRAQPQTQGTPTNIAPRSQPQPQPHGDCGNNITEEVTSLVRELVVDLNRSIGTQAGSSASGGSSGRNQAAAVAAPPENEEARRKGLDLNEMPSSEDDDEKEGK